MSEGRDAVNVSGLFCRMCERDLCQTVACKRFMSDCCTNENGVSGCMHDVHAIGYMFEVHVIQNS